MKLNPYCALCLLLKNITFAHICLSILIQFQLFTLVNVLQMYLIDTINFIQINLSGSQIPQFTTSIPYGFNLICIQSYPQQMKSSFNQVYLFKQQLWKSALVPLYAHKWNAQSSWHRHTTTLRPVVMLQFSYAHNFVHPTSIILWTYSSSYLHQHPFELRSYCLTHHSPLRNSTRAQINPSGSILCQLLSRCSYAVMKWVYAVGHTLMIC